MRWLWLVIALIGVSVVTYLAMFPSVTVRYRLTLEATLDGEPKVGSSVIEVTYSKQSNFANQPPLVIGKRGQAVVVQIGPRGTLFALLVAGTDVRSSPESILLRAFGFPYGVFPGSVDDGLRRIQHLSGKRNLPLTSLPLLVRFRDSREPSTVELVDPLDLGKSFGSDVKLSRATIEIVSAGIWPYNKFGITGVPLTTGIDSELPWLSSYYDRHLDGRQYESIDASSKLANSLSSGAFKVGKQP